MTFTASKVNDSRPQTAQLVAEATNTTALSTVSANFRKGTGYIGTASPTPVSQSNADTLLKQSQENQVLEAFLLGKLDPTSVITTCSVPTAPSRAQPNVNAILGSNYTSISTLISNNPNLDNSGILTAQKYAWAEQLCQDAMASGYVSAATILATMSGGN